MMDRTSVAASQLRQQAARPTFDLAAALARLDRRAGILEHALVGMEHAAAGVAAEELAMLGELTQEIREAITTVRLETDGLRLVGGGR